MIAEVPGFILLGRGVEKLKGFAIAYLLLISVVLTNLILSRHFSFYQQQDIEWTLDMVFNFIQSPPGVTFLIVCALVIAAHYVLMPVVLQILMFITRGLFTGGGNLFFFSIYVVLTKILRLKAEKKFHFIPEHELKNYLMYIIRVCYYKDGKIGRHRLFPYYKWYVLNVVYPPGRTVNNLSLITALLVSTWAVIYQYNFVELAPAVYYIVVCLTLFYLVNSIIVSWIVHQSGYFVGIIANSVSFPEFVESQQVQGQ
jgi:hypothetical protein